MLRCKELSSVKICDKKERSTQMETVLPGLVEKTCKLDVHGSVHHNTNLIEMTNKMLSHDSSRQRQTWVKPEAIITV